MSTIERTTPSEPELQRTLPRDAYLSMRHYEDEVERIFAREWFCAAREEQIPAAGDYLRLDAFGESVLVLRTRAGAIRAFYNVCRHRGSQLVPDEASEDAPAPPAHGRFKGAIKCPYHAWTYGLEGELRNAPFLDESHGLRREHLPLYPVGAATWGGFVFLNLSPVEAAADGRSLAVQLGEVPERLTRYPLAELLIGRRIRYDVAANWKCIVENYNECYHCGPVHPELCEIVPAFKEHGGAELDWDRGVPHREGATTFTFSGSTDRAPFPDLNEDERTRHKGELIYPNLMLSVSADHVVAFTLRPQGPGRTQIDCDFLFHPSEFGRPRFDPADAVEFWDVVNRQDWRICESVQRGMRSRPFRFGYYAPMEEPNLDVRRYVGERLGEPA